MPEQVVKVPRSASPVARAGAGDISERELSRERHNLQLQTTPPARVQPAHPKKQLFSAPVNKFTAKWCGPSPNLERIRSCLDAYANQETPTRRNLLPVLASPSVHGPAEEAAAAKICQFMLVAAWRRRREDVRCLRKTLETQVSYSERLRIQISALKSLLDSDNSKVRLAMRELERLKQLLRDKELEKAVLEREKLALEDDVCAAEDRASEMSIGWRNCRNELDGVRAAAAVSEHALALERAAHSDTLASRDDAYDRLAILEEDLAQHEELLSSAEAEVAALRRETEEKQRLLDVTIEKLAYEEEARSQCSRECAELTARVGAAADETGALRGDLAALRGDLARLQHDLAVTKEQLDWWPRPLTKMLGAARSWFRNPKAVPEAIIWTLIPARHGIP
ncbi:uncharacterized protein LOC111348629 isoform X2 [Spodoptera litura]|uniref:Uncharacterized protein LOC111348629 isoform X2 n=1 Tax=Spodoptera litura TaxID=69820 RepID=A0A9J7IH93_SPOLT|nr:uncharacterized protein LOC111348629 isoform X2 [Spodoptera litura]